MKIKVCRDFNTKKDIYLHQTRWHSIDSMTQVLLFHHHLNNLCSLPFFMKDNLYLITHLKYSQVWKWFNIIFIWINWKHFLYQKYFEQNILYLHYNLWIHFSSKVDISLSFNTNDGAIIIYSSHLHAINKKSLCTRCLYTSKTFYFMLRLKYLWIKCWIENKIKWS